MSFQELHEKSKRDTSKYLHINISYDKTVGEMLELNNLKPFMIKTKYKVVLLLRPNWLTLTGKTKGTSTSMSFSDCKSRTKMIDWSLFLQSSSYGSSKLRSVNGVMCFPEFRTPSEMVLFKVEEIDAEIKILQDKKQRLLDEVFDTEPLMKFSDLPKIFLETPKGEQKEVLNKILEHYKIEVKE